MNDKLRYADLVVDSVYGGSRYGNASDDPLPSLLGVDNGAGFRHLGKRPNADTIKLLALKSSLRDPDWPDELDHENGIFTYYGDNRKPRDLHSTPRQGNLILKNLFDARHQSGPIHRFPPIFVFANAGQYRDVRFLGLAVPGAAHLSADEDLVAVWRATQASNLRFQNYRSKFTILNVPKVTRAWITDIQAGEGVASDHAPLAWKKWLTGRQYETLRAPNTSRARSKTEQLPSSPEQTAIIKEIYLRYREDPFGFEKCALAIARLMLPRISEADLTRRSRDGGRDAIGLYKFGEGSSSINTQFALEAKCYRDGGVGVKELSRLISRIRHRQFGILCTTSYVANQAYKEILEDQHPIIIIAARDICDLLSKKVGSIETIRAWLNEL